MKYQRIAAWTGIFILVSYFLGNPVLAVDTKNIEAVEPNNQHQSPRELSKRNAAKIVARFLSELVDAKNYKQALNISNQAINNYPGNPLFHLYRGISLFHLNQKNASIPDFEIARKLFLSQNQSANTVEEKRLIRAGLRTIELYLFVDTQ